MLLIGIHKYIVNVIVPSQLHQYSSICMCLNVQWCWDMVVICLSHAGPMERSSDCLLPALEEEATDRARKDCLEEAFELALEERGFLLPMELVLLREERASGKKQREGKASEAGTLEGSMIDTYRRTYAYTENSNSNTFYGDITGVKSFVNHSIDSIHYVLQYIRNLLAPHVIIPLGVDLADPISISSALG